MGLADRPGFDLSRSGGRSPSFRTSEPWLVHNVFYLLAVSQWEVAVGQRGKAGLDGGVDLPSHPGEGPAGPRSPR